MEPKPGGDTQRVNRLLYRVLIAVVALLLLLCVAGALYLFTGIFSPKAPPRETRGVLRHTDSNEETAYLLEVLEYDEIENDYIRSWIDDKSGFATLSGKPVYHTLYGDNPSEPLDMYLYMPLARDVMGDVGLSNIRVSESGAALVISVETADNISRVMDSKDLILHIFVWDEGYEGSDVRTDRLYVNGARYNCPGATFIQLGVRS